MELKPFIILALPRSMTGWISCFLTVGNVFCQHEVYAPTRPVEDIVSSIRRQPAQFSGIACPGSLTIWRSLHLMMPEANFIYIRRPAESSKAALAKVAGVDPSRMDAGYEILESRASDYLQLAEPKVMDCEELTTLGGMRKLWEWACPGEHLPPEHLTKMHSLHIEQRKELFHAQVLGR